MLANRAILWLCLVFYLLDINQVQAQSKQYEFQYNTSYLSYLPKEYSKEVGKKWPLIFYLHGAGEWGNDLEKVKTRGLPKLLEEGLDIPFVVVAPQTAEGRIFSPLLLNELLNKVINEYKIDESRIYMTGISMGAYSTWKYSYEYADRLAAIAPIASGDYVTKRVWFLRRLPVWIFHNVDDPLAPVSESVNMAQALREHGAKPRLTIYDKADHGGWDETYNNPELYEWFMKHKRFVRKYLELDSTVLKSYTGLYKFFKNDLEVQISLKEEVLHIQFYGQPPIQLIPSAIDQFYIKGDQTDFSFTRGSDGKVSGLIIDYIDLKEGIKIK